MVLALILFLFLVNTKCDDENKRNLNKNGTKIFIVIQIVFMEHWLFLRMSKVYQWEAEQFGGSSLDFKFFKFFFYFKLASKLAHRLQRERLMYFLRVESRDWIHSRTSRKGWKNLTNGYLTNDERIGQYLQTERSESGPKITANPIASRLREHMKKIELIFF